MRKFWPIVVLTIAVLGLFSVPAHAAEEKTILVAEKIVLVAECPPQAKNVKGLECVKYTVIKGDNLSKIARLYSTSDRKLTWQNLIAMDANKYVLLRGPIEKGDLRIPRPGMKPILSGANLLFPGDEITLPFVLKKDVENKERNDSLEKVLFKAGEKIEKIQKKLDLFKLIVTVLVALAILEGVLLIRRS